MGRTAAEKARGGSCVDNPDSLVTAVVVPSSPANSKGCHVLDMPAILRLFQLRSSQIMWALGAGASRSAGIKTAGDIIWNFKQRLYRSQNRLPPTAITDIGEPAVQRKFQAHFDALGGFPPAGSEMEYSAYFEAAYHAPKDRSAYLDELIARGESSFGHLALALLMSEDLCRIVWTTNFGRMLEDAVAKVLGSTGRLLTAELGEPSRGGQRKGLHQRRQGDPRAVAARSPCRSGTHRRSVPGNPGTDEMDWNNDGPYDRLPATLNFADMLATIVKRLPKLQPQSYPERLFM